MIRVASVRTRLATLVAAATLVSTVVLSAQLSGAATQDPLFGNDVSWPQCSVTHGGYALPMPPADADFMIIGLSRGLAFTENPCLPDQVRHARTNGTAAHAYAMATFPTAGQLSRHGSAGPFDASTHAGRLRNTGYAEAEYALGSLGRVGWLPSTIWVDVEPRAAQPWSDDPSENRWVIEGLLRRLHDAGVAYGLYSYAAGWQEITGGWSLSGLPVWATAGKLDYPNEARDRCTQTSFSGGEVYLSQWWLDNTVDYNLTCGRYRFSPPPLRVFGADRVETSVAASQRAFPAGAKVAFVVSGADFADALSGGPAAARAQGPILLTDPRALSPAVQRELQRLRPQRVYILGGPAAVSTSVATQISEQWPVERVSGPDRYATASEVANRFSGGSRTIFVTLGSSFPDALAAGPAAVREDSSILLTRRDVLPPATTARLAALAPERILVIGGSAAVSDPVLARIRAVAPGSTVHQIAGPDRYATARAVATRFWPDGSAQAFVATGMSFPDALSAAPLAAGNGAPIVLARTTCVPAASRMALDHTGAALRTLVGGQRALTSFVLDIPC